MLCAMICLFVFLFYTKALSVYLRSLILTVPLVSFAPLLSLNNPYFSLYMHLIYPSELEIKDNTDTRRIGSYLDLFFNIDTDFTVKYVTNGTNAVSHFSAETYTLFSRVVFTYFS